MANPEVTDETIEQADGVAVADDGSADQPETLQEKLKSLIQVSIDDVGVLRKKLTITVPREAIADEEKSQYDEIVADAVIPGFRRGRAPHRLVEKRFGREVGEQILSKIVGSAYMAATEKENLKILGDPMIWARAREKGDSETEAPEQLMDLQAALEHLQIPAEGDFKFRCEIEVRPEIKLPKLEGVVVERPKLDITDDDVTSEIDRVRTRRGNMAPVLDGVVEADDLLICDFKMSVNGEEIKTVDNIQVAARPQRVEGITLEDFGDQVLGCKTGDVRSLDGTLPDDYDREDLRGKTATLTFTIQDIKRLQLPPMDEDYLESLGFDSDKEYRASVKESMSAQLEREIRNGMRRQVSEFLVKNVPLDLPEGLSTRQTDRVVERRILELHSRGVPQNEIDKHADELRTSAREQVVNDLKLHFILEQVAEDFDLDIREEEVNARIAAIARAYGRRFDRVRDDLAREGGLESLYLQIRDEKCLDRILESAEITEAKVERKKAATSDSEKTKKTTAKKAAPADSAKKTTTKSTTEKIVEKTKSKKKTSTK